MADFGNIIKWATSATPRAGLFLIVCGVGFRTLFYFDLANEGDFHGYLYQGSLPLALVGMTIIIVSFTLWLFGNLKKYIANRFQIHRSNKNKRNIINERIPHLTIPQLSTLLLFLSQPNGKYKSLGGFPPFQELADFDILVRDDGRVILGDFNGVATLAPALLPQRERLLCTVSALLIEKYRQDGVAVDLEKVMALVLERAKRWQR